MKLVLNESQSIQPHYVTVGDNLEGMMGNANDYFIDMHLSLYSKYGRLLKVKRYDDLIILINADEYDFTNSNELANKAEILPINCKYKEVKATQIQLDTLTFIQQQLLGNLTYVFKSEEELQAYIEMYEADQVLFT